MIQWYSHLESIQEGLTETKSELAALVATHREIKEFLKLEVQYLELLKHRALAQGEKIEGIDLALGEMKRLVEPKPKSEENEDE